VIDGTIIDDNDLSSRGKRGREAVHGAAQVATLVVADDDHTRAVRMGSAEVSASRRIPLRLFIPAIFRTSFAGAFFGGDPQRRPDDGHLCATRLAYGQAGWKPALPGM